MHATEPVCCKFDLGKIHRHRMKSLLCVVNNQGLKPTMSTGTFKYKPDICISIAICKSTEQCKKKHKI